MSAFETTTSGALSDVVRLDAEQRLSIPSPLIRHSKFVAQEKQRLVAELVDAGVVRLRRPETWTAIEATRKALLAEHTEGTASVESLGAFADRFREATLYTDGRVRLVEAVLVQLETDPNVPRPWILIEAWPNHVDLYNLAARQRRLDRYRREHAVGP
jgi:hypothetical protein